MAEWRDNGWLMILPDNVVKLWKDSFKGRTLFDECNWGYFSVPAKSEPDIQTGNGVLEEVKKHERHITINSLSDKQFEKLKKIFGL